MDNLQPGQTIGPYRIINQVGQGGMATVYKAYHAAMDRYVAIKVLPRQLAVNPEFTGRFRREARTIANLEHLHILPVYDSGESEGIPYLVMRYLEAGTLKERLEAGPLSLTEVDRYFTQLADALGYAHKNGVIHRDLKPSNALVDAQGNVFLTDFGIAKILESGTKFTKTDAVIGTPDYISPEQAQGEKVDQRSDIYSLGIILYEMVTGRVPFEADTPLAVILKHIQAPLPMPSAVKSDVSPAIERVILKALAKDRDDRYASVADFLAAWKSAFAESASSVSTKVDDATAVKPIPTPAAPVVSTPVAAQTPATPVVVQSRSASPTVMIAGVVGAFVLFVMGGCFVLMLAGVIPNIGNILKPEATAGATVAAEVSTPAPKPTTIVAWDVATPEKSPTPQKRATPQAIPTSAGGGATTELPPALPTAEPTVSSMLTTTNVTNNPGKSEIPQLVFDEQGVLHFVWHDNSLRDSGGDILHRQMTTDGKWSEAENLTPSWAMARQYNLALRLNPAGQVCVFVEGAVRDTLNWGMNMRCLTNGRWSEAVKAGKDYYDKSPAFAPDGTVKTVRNISYELYFNDSKLSDKKTAYTEAFAIDKAGGYHVIWLRQGEPQSIEYRYSKDNGKTWTEAERLTDDEHQAGTSFQLLADNQGNVHLVWGGYAANSATFFYRHWTPDGGWGPTINIQGDASVGAGFALTVDAKDLAHVVWQGIGGSGVWYTQQLADETWSAPRQLSTDSSFDNPAIAVDKNGARHFVWTKDGDDVDDLYYAVLP